MLDRLFRIANGTGPGAWLIYMGVMGLLFGLLAPDRPLFVGALVGTLSAFRVELNGYRARVEALEAGLPGPGPRGPGATESPT